ncbi:SOS response-associated peptidase, partial [Pseudomonas sp. HMWF031]
MCGRFALSIPASDLPLPLRQRLDPAHQNRYAPRDLIGPGEPLLVLRREDKDAS